MVSRLSRTWMTVGAFAAMTVVPSLALAFRSGPPPERNGSTASAGASCMQCHGSASGSGSVEILGAPIKYEPSTTYNLSVKISDTVQLGAGFQLSVEDNSGAHVGTLVLTDLTNTQFTPGDVDCPDNDCWVSHTGNGVDNAVTGWAGNGDSATYNVDWISPASNVGTVTFWAAGNAINNNFSSSGDIVYLASASAGFMPPVPAVSTWGIVTLTLVMLVAASVLIARRTTPVRVRV